MAGQQIGLVGLGIMGKPMARNLMKAGYSLTVYDVVGSAVEEIATEGTAAASSSSEVAQACPVVITMVPDSADSEAAILGPDGVLEGASAGSTVIDMSSIAPGSSQKIAAACEAQGVDFLDAPVSGGEPGAISGTLAIMVGGRQEVFDRSRPIFEAVGASIVLCGGYGAGNTTKLANQIIVAANIEALAEGLVLARKAGLDPNTVFEAIKGGLAGSNVMNAKAPMMIAGDFKPGFRDQAPPEGPAQRAAHREGARRASAGHRARPADAGLADERRQRRLRPLRHRQVPGGHGGRSDQRWLNRGPARSW